MNVPKLRFKEFDGEWEERKLKDLILTVEAGVSVNSKDASVSDTVSKAVLKTSAISKGNFNHKENKKVIEEDLERVKKPVKADTILVSRMNTPALVGEVGYVENDYPNLYLPDRLWEVEVDKEITTAKWLVSALVTDKNEYKIKSLGTGTSGSMKNIAKSDFLNIDIKVPNLKEQIKIQSFIGILNKKIQLQQQKIDLLQEQKKGFLQKMFPKADETQPEMRFDGFIGDWEEYKLGGIVDFYSGLTYSPDDVLEKDGTFVLRSSNIKDGNIVNADNVYVNSLMVNSEKIKQGDIIVVVRNGSRNLIGKHAIVKKEMSNTVIGAFMTGIRAEIPDFINALLDTEKFNIEISKNLGATINQITTGSFKKMIFTIPAEEEQSKIGRFFRAIDDSLEIQKQKLKLLQKQKQGFMQQMFI